MNQYEIINKTTAFIKNRFQEEGSGHDWWHIYRVCRLARTIAETEGGDLFIIEMASLLHDLDDWKISDGENQSETIKWLNGTGLGEDDKKRILEVIDQVSFKGAKVDTPANTIEAKIVQDADRLDAIGAIGVARAFAYGGSRGRLIYDPDSGPVMHQSFNEYKKSGNATVNHFYEKLLLLKDRMQTIKGKEFAESRHRFLVQYLEQFFNEWDGKI